MRSAITLIALLVALAACSNDANESATPSATTTPPTVTPPAETPTALPPDFDPVEFVRLLAADDMAGRDNDTEQSARAQQLLVDTLRPLTEPAIESEPGDDGYLQHYDQGTNVIGVIHGSGALATEYVLVSAHYDHFAPGECDQLGTTDEICNGATDNAAGVAQVIAIAAALRDTQRTAPDSDRRSVLLTLWDGEEDGFTGSRFYLANPIVALEQIAVVVNFDIQGSSFAPALVSATFLVGAETGGSPLQALTADVAATIPELDFHQLSRVFGLDRSDHRTFAEAGVPILFLTDAPNGCYHTVYDDFAHLDTTKLLAQIAASTRLVHALTTEAERPRFALDPPLATFRDAEEFLRLLTRVTQSNLFENAASHRLETAATQLQTIVRAGPAAFDDEAVLTLLTIADAATDQLATLDCR